MSNRLVSESSSKKLSVSDAFHQIFALFIIFSIVSVVMIVQVQITCLRCRFLCFTLFSWSAFTQTCTGCKCFYSRACNRGIRPNNPSSRIPRRIFSLEQTSSPTLPRIRIFYPLEFDYRPKNESNFFEGFCLRYSTNSGRNRATREDHAHMHQYLFFWSMALVIGYP